MPTSPAVRDCPLRAPLSLLIDQAVADLRKRYRPTHVLHAPLTDAALPAPSLAHQLTSKWAALTAPTRAIPASCDGRAECVAAPPGCAGPVEFVEALGPGSEGFLANVAEVDEDCREIVWWLMHEVATQVARATRRRFDDNEAADIAGSFTWKFGTWAKAYDPSRGTLAGFLSVWMQPNSLSAEDRAGLRLMRPRPGEQFRPFPETAHDPHTLQQSPDPYSERGDAQLNAQQLVEELGGWDRLGIARDKHLHEMTNAEIAEARGTTESSVRAMYSQQLRKLRSRLRDLGVRGPNSGA